MILLKNHTNYGYTAFWKEERIGAMGRKVRWICVILAAVMLLTLLPGCAGSKTAGKDRDAITVYMWSGGLYDSYAPYVQSQLPAIITCRRFALHDAAGLKDTGSVHLRGGGQGL